MVLEPLNLKALQCIAAVEEDPVQRQVAPTSPAIVLYQNGKSHWKMGRKLRFFTEGGVSCEFALHPVAAEKIICCQQPPLGTSPVVGNSVTSDHRFGMVHTHRVR